MPAWLEITTRDLGLAIEVIGPGRRLPAALRSPRRILYGRKPRVVGYFGKSLFFLPAMFVVWLGLTFSSSEYLTVLGRLNPIEWVALLSFRGCVDGHQLFETGIRRP